MNRTVAGKPPNGPSGPRRGCAVRAFCHRQNLGAGAALPPRALKSRRAERAFGPRSPQKRTRLTSCPFLWKKRSKWIFEMRAMMRTRGRKPPNRPSGRRRGCAVRAFCRRQNLGAGAALPPRALKSRRVEPPCGRRNPQKRTSAKQMSFFVVREAGVEPARPCEHWHLKPASLPIPPLARGEMRCSLARGICYHTTPALSTPFFVFHSGDF